MSVRTSEFYLQGAVMRAKSRKARGGFRCQGVAPDDSGADSDIPNKFIEFSQFAPPLARATPLPLQCKGVPSKVHSHGPLARAAKKKLPFVQRGNP